jgi:dCTP deaminase
LILSDSEIRDAIASGLIVVDPTPKDYQYKSSALDLHFDGPVYRYKTDDEINRGEAVHRPVIVDSRDVKSHEMVQQYGEEIPMVQDHRGIQCYKLDPHKFVLARTLERIVLPGPSKIAARIEGRSSIARLGLVVHLTAPTVHINFKGRLVLEMRNFGEYPIHLYPGETRICQLIFEKVGREPLEDLKTEHQGQTGAN